MPTCLPFQDLVESSEAPILEMRRVGAVYPSGESLAACEAFSKQVRTVESVLIQTYGMAAMFAKRSGELQEAVNVWERMGRYCEKVINELASLKSKYPECGTPEVYDLALDYRAACEKRFREALDELSCQTTNLPKGLFPSIR